MFFGTFSKIEYLRKNLSIFHRCSDDSALIRNFLRNGRVRGKPIERVRVNRYRRKRSKVDASIFDSALSHTRRSNTFSPVDKFRVPAYIGYTKIVFFKFSAL